MIIGSTVAICFIQTDADCAERGVIRGCEGPMFLEAVRIVANGRKKELPIEDQRLEMLLVDYVDILQAILEGIAAKWGMVYRIRWRDGKADLVANSDRLVDFCRRIQMGQEGGVLCQQCESEYPALVAEFAEPLSFDCKAGLTNVAVPIIIGGKAVATVVCGRWRLASEKDDREDTSWVSELEKELGFAPGELLGFWEEIPEVSQDQIRQIEDELVTTAKRIARLMTDRIELKTARDELDARFREARAIDKIVLRYLGNVITIDKFWWGANKTLKGICRVIGASYAGFLESKGADQTQFMLRAFSEFPQKELIGREYWVEESPILRRALDEGNFVTTNLHSLGEDKLRGDILASTPGAILSDCALAQSFELSEGIIGIMVFFAEARRDRASGLPFEQEKQLITAVRPYIVHSYQNCQLFSRQKDFEKMRSRFIQDITHQLAGPLAGIQAHCENLLEGRLSVERGRNVLRSLVEQARMNGRYARNFAWIAKTEASPTLRAEVDVTKENMTKLLIECARDLQGLAASRSIRIHVDEMTVDRLPEIAVDRNLFRQAALNLLENAVKYSDKGTIITVAASLKGGTVQLLFTNYGIPIREEDTSRIFQRYIRTKEAQERVPVGTGVGLSVAKEIIEAHDGKIEVRPSVRTPLGYETTFTITLPLRRQRRIVV